MIFICSAFSALVAALSRTDDFAHSAFRYRLTAMLSM
jgi:hypothetical protein